MTSATHQALVAELNTASYFKGNNVLFIHNWRCAGTSLHSLLKANLRKRYLKIGDPLNRYGKGRHNPNLASLSTSLRYLRGRSTKGAVVAGHIFMGLESFLPGNWDFWMNAREPVARLRSGLLRFHARDTTHGKRKSYDLIKPSRGLVDRDSLADVLATSLQRERNGICRRLASMTLAKRFSLLDTDNIEQISILEEGYTDEDLFNASLERLDRINALFLAEHFHASVISIEKIYGLAPLINPFTVLRHNSARVSGFTTEHEKCVDANLDLIMESQVADLKLWPFLLKKFRYQISELGISKQEIATRELIHHQPLFNEEWFAEEEDQEKVVELMATAVVKRARSKPELAPSLCSTILAWPLLSDLSRERLDLALKRMMSKHVTSV